MSLTVYQNTDKTLCVWALYPDKTLFVSILYIKNTCMLIFTSQFEPLFWVQRDTLFMECFLSRSKNSLHMFYRV